MDYEGMAAVVARYLLTQPKTYLVLSEFVYDEQGDLTGVRSLASANREHSFSTRQFTLRWSQVPKRLRQSIMDDELYMLPNVITLTDETNNMDFVRLLADGRVRSYVHIPVLVDGHPVIGLGIASQELHTFSNDDLDSIRNAASQVGMLVYARTLIDRAQQSRNVAEDMLQQTHLAAEALRQRISTLQAVNEMAIMTASSQDYQTLLDTGARGVVDLTGVDHCGIVIINPDQISATVVSEYPPQNAVGAQLNLEDNGLWDALRRDPTTPVLIESVERDTRLEPNTRAVMEMLGIKSLAVLPLVVEGELRGGVGLDIYDASRSVTANMIDIAKSVTTHLSVALRTQELLRDTQAAADQLAAQVNIQRTLNHLAQIVNRAEDETTLRDATIEAMFKLLKVDHAGLVMLDANGIWGTIVSDYPPQGVLGVKFEVAKNPLLRMMAEQDKAETIVIEDIESSPLFDEGGRAALRQVGTRSLLLVPVVVEGKLAGSFGMDYFATGQDFSPQVIEIAETIMRQFAIGLSRLRLLADTRRRADQLEHIARLGQVMQSTLDVGVILREVILETLQMLPIDQMSIALYEPEQAMLRSVAEYYRGQTSIDLNSTQMLDISGQVSRAWLKRELVYIPDLQSSEYAISADVDIHSWAIVPVIARSQVLGIMSLGSAKSAAFSETDLAVVQQLASQVAASLTNIEAFAQSQRIARNEALVNTISTRLQQQIDVSNMLDVTAQELGRALGARRARIRLGAQPTDNEGTPR
jgi:GAF domain-containing protein